MSIIKPITPAEIGAAKATAIPPEVIKVFNDLIARHFVNDSATFRQSEVLDHLAIEMGAEFTSPDAGAKWTKKVFRNGWLNVEDLYHDVGWIVEYDKPGFNESYPATFTFTKP